MFLSCFWQDQRFLEGPSYSRVSMGTEGQHVHGETGCPLHLCIRCTMVRDGNLSGLLSFLGPEENHTDKEGCEMHPFL